MRDFSRALRFGLELANAAPDFALTVCYILFDTRMDLEEAHVSPLDADLPEEMRLVNIRTIPEEIFMLIRVVALIRGMLISLDTDVHARMIWRPYAIAALRAAVRQLDTAARPFCANDSFFFPMKKLSSTDEDPTRFVVQKKRERVLKSSTGGNKRAIFYPASQTLNCILKPNPTPQTLHVVCTTRAATRRESACRTGRWSTRRRWRAPPIARRHVAAPPPR